MLNSMVMFTFSVIDQIYPFRVNLVLNSKFSVQVEKCYLDYLKYAKFEGDVHLFCVSPEILFLG